MSSDSSRLTRIAHRLSSLPSIALPTDHPRPSHSSNQKLVEASIDVDLNHRASLALARLSLYEDDTLDPLSNNPEGSTRPSPFHILLATFLTLLHRYTGETDIVVATSSPSADHLDPLLLTTALPPERSFWGLVRAIELLEKFVGLLFFIWMPSILSDPVCFSPPCLHVPAPWQHAQQRS